MELEKIEQVSKLVNRWFGGCVLPGGYNWIDFDAEDISQLKAEIIAIFDDEVGNA